MGTLSLVYDGFTGPKPARLRAHLEAKREDVGWRLAVSTERLGYAAPNDTSPRRAVIEKIVADKDIEREMMETALLVRNWFVEKARSPKQMAS